MDSIETTIIEVKFTTEEAQAIRQVFDGLQIKLTAPDAAKMIETWNGINAKLEALTEK